MNQMHTHGQFFLKKIKLVCIFSDYAMVKVKNAWQRNLFSTIISGTYGPLFGALLEILKKYVHSFSRYK